MKRHPARSDRRSRPSRRDRFAGDWHWREHRGLQRRQCAAASAAELSRCRPARDSVEPIAGPEHPGRLVFHRAVLRHQANSHSGLRGAGDRDRRQLQPDRQRRSRNASASSACRRICCRCWAPGRAAASSSCRKTMCRGAPGPRCSVTASGRAGSAATRPSIGTSIILNGQSYQIVGVLPETFRLPREVLPTLGVAEDGEIFLPLPLPPTAPTTRTREDYNIIGKLKPGVDGRRRAGGNGHAHGAAAARLPGLLSAARRPHVLDRAAARSGRRQCPAHGHRARWRRRVRAAHRVRERREPAAVARARPAARAGDSRGARRHARQIVRQLLNEARRALARRRRCSAWCSRGPASRGFRRCSPRTCRDCATSASTARCCSSRRASP